MNQSLATPFVNNRNGGSSEDPEKRLAILEQAIQTFAEFGFRGADVQVIADRAGVGKGTVYRYFHSKEDLFWATTFEVMLRLERELFGSMEGVEGARARIRASCIAYAKFFETNPQYLEVFVQDRAEFRGTGPESHREYHQQLVRRFEEVLRQGIEAGELRPVDTQHTTLTLGNLLYGIVVLGGHLTSLSAVEMAEHSIDIFLRGISAEAPLDAESSCLIGSQRS
jgi:AcrR family transcriptional regulator